MSFPLGSLQADGLADHGRQASGGWRWPRQVVLGAAAVLWLLVLLALLTHSATDPGFSTSGTGAPLANRAGLLGAWLSDLLLFVFGYSAWWLLLVALRAWLSALAHSLRGTPPDAGLPPRWVFGLGLALLMLASCAL